MFLDFRKIENLHILLWLLKDICWAADLKWLGTFMIIPTISVALWLTWENEKILFGTDAQPGSDCLDSRQLHLDDR